MTGSPRSPRPSSAAGEPGICVVGLGRVGLAVAAALGHRGLAVCGVDTDPRRVAVATGKATPDDEPGVAEALGRSGLQASASHAESVRGASISYVIVPTPSDARGAYDLRFVRNAFAQIGRALAGHDDPHTVVLASTVLPGATRYALQPVLEEAAGRRIGDGLELCYSPPFVALGSVMHDFLHPDVALVGVADGVSGSAVEELYRRAFGSHVPVKIMSLENAELAKLAVNTFLTMKISFANTLAAICEQLPGGDVDLVTEAVGTDSRIGPKLLRGGLGYGGPCLPRDNAALAFLAESIGVTAQLARGTDAVDDALSTGLLRDLSSRLSPGSRAVVLGVAYKPGTSVVEGSPGLRLARSLAASGVCVVAYDGLAATAAREAISGQSSGAAINVVDDPDDLPHAPDLVVLSTPDPDLAALALRIGPPVIFDPWRVVDRERLPAGTRLLQRGRPVPTAPDDEAFAAVRGLGLPDETTHTRPIGVGAPPVERRPR